MADEDKIKQVLDLVSGLTDEDRQLLVNELIQDTDLMGILLNALMNLNLDYEAENSKDAGGFIDFLKKVKD